jgi:hypothetical protein
VRLAKSTLIPDSKTVAVKIKEGSLSDDDC